ncbi:hypothetical protein VII00023_05677 [Vibrio ichthyoenteri ATCC 700023]|uniref:Cytochrome oxidase biogenesis cluster protein n=1 Tax=Vibrio ichthyoenteri ATCC 700023 TaxID=870968 RepID=F9S6C9_9VIBR|nr:hypothetical protein [Vibrio ichthyoenteri]EGU33755.1 hypothetical protein VII00023_05677 [Vibrio ichthyoenteri ATCC 700023]
MKPSVTRGRMMLLALIFVFALPALLAKLILQQQWYTSGVTNKGTLIDPNTSFASLGVDNPYFGERWQLGYVMPEKCDALCLEQLHLLKQSHTALGKYQQRVEPVILLSSGSDQQAIAQIDFPVVPINSAFEQVVDSFEYVIVDPRGQLVMRYPKVDSADNLVAQSKGLLADLRKLLKLSRVG